MIHNHSGSTGLTCTCTYRDGVGRPGPVYVCVREVVVVVWRGDEGMRGGEYARGVWIPGEAGTP